MINKNTVGKTECFDGFSGMDASSPFGKGTTYSLKNFRVLSDGSIEKREGYRHLATLPDLARAVCVFEDSGEEVLLAVAGNCLCRIRKADGDLQTAPVFATTEGNILFIRHEGVLYILDGETFYRYDGGVSVTEGEAHIPIIGKGWPVNAQIHQSVHEEPNLFCRKACFMYAPPSSTNTAVNAVCFDRPVASVDHIFAGTTDLSGRKITLDEDGRRLAFESPCYLGGKELRVYVTLPDGGKLPSVTQAFSYEGLGFSRLFLYGGDDPSVVYASCQADTDPMVQPSHVADFQLYFPAASVSSFGKGRRVNAIRRMARKLLVFLEKESLISKDAVDNGEPIDFISLSKEVGCSATEGVHLLDEKTLVVVDRVGIYKITVDVTMEEDCVIRRISDSIGNQMGSAFCTGVSLCSHRKNSELWFADPSGKGEIFVYCPDSGNWCVYDGIRADFIVDLWGDVAFLEGQFVNLFDKTCTVDKASYGELDIEARFKSHYFDLGKPESDKRLSGTLILTDLDGGALEVRLSDGGYLAEFTLDGDANPNFPYLYERALKSGRFRFASLELRATGAARQRVFGAKVFV